MSAQFRQGLTAHQQGRLRDAEALYKQVLKSDPNYFDALHLLGVLSLQTNRAERGIELIQKALALDPAAVSAIGNLGAGFYDLDRFEEALDCFDKVIALRPRDAGAHCNRGNALNGLKRFDDALAAYDTAITIEPRLTEAHVSRGNTLSDLERFADAVAAYDIAIKLEGRAVDALSNRGNALARLDRYEEALASYDKATAIAPSYADAHYNRAKTLRHLGRLEEALASYDKAIAAKPDFRAAHFNRGGLLNDLGRFREAVASYDTVIHLNARDAEAYIERGRTLSRAGLQEDAIKSFDRALKLDPKNVDALVSRGSVLVGLRRFDEADETYSAALAIDRDHDFLFGNWLSTKLYKCDWTDWDARIAELESRLKGGQKASAPFNLFALLDDPDLQRRAAEAFTAARVTQNRGLPAILTHPRHDVIRIGYFSADFRIHPVSLLCAELFERHTRSQFQVMAFSFGHDTQDPMRRRLEAAFDKFIDVGHKTDLAIASLARDLEIDIAIDLMGMTQSSRPGIFAARAAPIQINYLGYPGTVGADYIDYLIADRVTVPVSHRAYYREKIVALPGSFMPQDTKRAISDKLFTRSALGLPETGFVFCCFNASYKFNPRVFDCWMTILRNTPGSVLWLAETNSMAIANLKSEAAARDVDPSRLVSAGRTESLEEHLARYRAADLFLDTWPYNAHATASDALWAGVPVLTLAGETFPARVGASLVNAIGLGELSETTDAAYIASATALAAHPDKLAAVKHKLSLNRTSGQLFDMSSYVKHIEEAYRAMYDKHLAGAEPEHIRIDDF
ncbi:protein O-GlcNAc transferase [Nitrobacteraceae bacterium AZCC 1564]